MRRTFDDGTVEEFEMELMRTGHVGWFIESGGVPPVDTSVVGRRWSEEFIVEWASVAEPREAAPPDG
jgi:hypothetical protein